MDKDILISRINAKTQVDSVTGCWIWSGKLNNSLPNRPVISFEKKIEDKRVVETFTVHKFLYEEKNGPSCRYIDNMCGNGRCVNPEHHQSRTFEIRFWDNVEKPDGDGGCWLWSGPASKNGYGVITVGHQAFAVHRVSWEKHNNEKVPSGLMVCHKCNVKLCINPDHLYIGTHNDNMRDMSNSNVLKGDKNPKALLSENDVREIKQHIRERRIVYRNLAKMYGVSRQAIQDIASGRTWSWIEL